MAICLLLAAGLGVPGGLAQAGMGADRPEELIPGDLNFDGRVDLDDARPFLKAVQQPEAFLAEHPWLSEDELLELTDLSGDGQAGRADIELFREKMVAVIEQAEAEREAAAPPWRPAGLYEDEGWTRLEPSEDSRLIYVSSSEGDDRNNGLSPARPMRTLEAAAEWLRDGHPDWLLLKAGDAWEDERLSTRRGRWTRSGRSEDEMMVVTAYGEGPRPVLRGGGVTAMGGGGSPERISHVAFVGLEFYNHRRDPDSPDFVGAANVPSEGGRSNAIRWLREGENILFEDIKAHFYRLAIYFDGPDNVRVRRCIIVDQYSIRGEEGHSQGAFFAGSDGVLFEENVFDHNGWNEQLWDDGAFANLHNHNIYASRGQSHATNTVYRGNIVSRGSSIGLSEATGLIENNFLPRNSFAIGIRTAPTTLKDNVIYESGYHNPDTGARGDGVWINDRNNTSGGPAKVLQNIALNQVTGTSRPAFHLRSDEMNKDWLHIHDNIAHNWTKHVIRFDSRYPEGSFKHSRNIVDGTTLQGDEVQFKDPNRNLETYMRSLEKTGGFEAFIQYARERSRGIWDSTITASGVNEYIRQGFAVAGDR